MEIQVPTRVPNATPITDAQLNDDNFVARFAGQLTPPNIWGTTDYNPFSGRVLYVPVLSVDQPVGMVRYNYSNRSNTGVIGTDSLLIMPTASMALLWDQVGGVQSWCNNGAERCSGTREVTGATAFQAVNFAAQLFMLERPKFVNLSWQGTLLVDKADGTRTNSAAIGTMIRRRGGLRRKTPSGSRGGSTCMGMRVGIRSTSPIRLGCVRNVRSFLLKLAVCWRQCSRCSKVRAMRSWQFQWLQKAVSLHSALGLELRQVGSQGRERWEQLGRPLPVSSRTRSAFRRQQEQPRSESPTDFLPPL